MENSKKVNNTNFSTKDTQTKLEKMREIAMNSDKAREIAQKLTQYIKEK